MSVLRSTRRAEPSAARPLGPVDRRSCCKDERWPAIAAALAELRDADRHSIRILDMDCGAGSLLLHVVRHARALGFTAIEARGVDGVPALIGRARVAASHVTDLAIGITFETADLMMALAEEREFPADILIWHGHVAGMDHDAVVRAVAAAGNRIIADAAPKRGARA